MQRGEDSENSGIFLVSQRALPSESEKILARENVFRETREGCNCRLNSRDSPHGRWGQRRGSVDPRFVACLPFPMPEIVEFVACVESVLTMSMSKKKRFTKFSVCLKRVSLRNSQVRTNFMAFPLERTRKEPRSSVRSWAATGA